MKNLKNTATAIALAATLMVGTASANTEILMSDAPQPTQCTVNYTNVIKSMVGKFFREILGEPRIFYMKEFVPDDSTCSEITPDGYRRA